VTGGSGDVLAAVQVISKQPRTVGDRPACAVLPHLWRRRATQSWGKRAGCDAALVI